MMRLKKKNFFARLFIIVSCLVVSQPADSETQLADKSDTTRWQWDTTRWQERHNPLTEGHNPLFCSTVTTETHLTTNTADETFLAVAGCEQSVYVELNAVCCRLYTHLEFSSAGWFTRCWEHCPLCGAALCFYFVCSAHWKSVHGYVTLRVVFMFQTASYGITNLVSVAWWWHLLSWPR